LVIDQAYQDRPGNKDIQPSILYNAKINLDVYDDWREYFRKHQPPTLITWGKNDGIFTVEGAELFKRDIPSAELHLLETGHFALEEEVDRIGSFMHEFSTDNKQAISTEAGVAKGSRGSSSAAWPGRAMEFRGRIYSWPAKEFGR
jgi:hypothetical protein